MNSATHKCPLAIYKAMHYAALRIYMYVLPKFSCAILYSMWYMPYSRSLNSSSSAVSQSADQGQPPPPRPAEVYCTVPPVWPVPHPPPPHPEVCVHCTLSMLLLSRPAYRYRGFGSDERFLYLHRYSAMNLTKEVRRLNNLNLKKKMAF
jgi:hypothetical protein